MDVFVIGNGLSRTGFDLESLRSKGHIIGCNWIYRDFLPDTVTMIDTPCIYDLIEIYGRGNPLPFKQLTQSISRKDILLDGVKIDERFAAPYFNNSGAMSTWYAIEHLNASRVFLIGIDFFRPTPALNTEGKPTNDVYGINTIGGQVQKCFNHMIDKYPHVEFIRVGPIEDSDKEFYKTEVHPKMTYMETLEI